MNREGLVTEDDLYRTTLATLAAEKQVLGTPPHVNALLLFILLQCSATVSTYLYGLLCLWSFSINIH